jgi:hypothetical protein
VFENVVQEGVSDSASFTVQVGRSHDLLLVRSLRSLADL